ncbi:hypothetical protein KJ877_00720 [bacterium]|nr:hypothetical protein [bacterium]MBU1989550.1 hypothetical protein [bacterium]
MSEGFDKIKEIGAQKVYEKTHIVKQHVQAILHESFDQMTKVQFLGFISILERDYNVDLSDLRKRGLEYFKQNSAKTEESERIFVAAQRKKNYSALYMALGVFVFILAVYYTLSSVEPTSEDEKLIDSSAIENAQKNISGTIEDETDSVDENLTQDENATMEDTGDTPAAAAVAEPEPAEVSRSLKIIPKAKLWMGYIDADTHQKYQKLFSDELEMDANRSWLLFLGHGSVNIEVNGEAKEFRNNNNIRFLYKDGNLTQIDTEKFESLNRGNKW